MDIGKFFAQPEPPPDPPGLRDRVVDFWSELGRWVRLEQVIYGNPVRQWLIALAVFVVAALVFRIIKAIVARRAGKIAERTRTNWDDAVVETLQATKLWFLLVLALFCGSLVLELPEKTRQIVQSVAIITLLVQVAVWGTVMLTLALTGYVKRRMAEDAAAATTITALGFLGKLVLYAVIVLLILDNLGVDVTALVAGLGVGGIAVALAAQNILGDLFASLSIVLDKPFVLGDFIIVGDLMGTVERIGLKTTRVRSLSGEQLIFANNDLLQSRIRNFKRMFERRVVFSVGVVYHTPHEKVAAIPQMIREIVESLEQTRFDRSHLKEFGDSALLFETVYYVLVPNFNLYMDRQQSINLALLERFAAEGIEFAYPTQTILLEAGAETEGDERRTSNAEKATSNIEHRTSNVEQ
ncbi:MAG: mechanosensitive ion channel family protein [Planctomycetes bacterium]|nr:mechanosensitive ion channel family protein [Planctomycetota bacterium]